MKRCFRCNATVEEREFFSRRDECGACGADLHVCKNCSFYRPGRSNECEEPQAERVADKERSNYCDFFRFKDEQGEAALAKDDAKKAWDQLFKKP
jgi:hypothetical protein